MPNYQVFNILKLKESGAIKKISNHNLRIVDTENADKKRTPLNRFYAGSKQTDSLAELQSRLETVPKPRKDAVKVVNLVLSASPDFFIESDRNTILDWEKAMFKWAENQFGKENIIYGVVHADEKTKHLHLSFVPIKDGKLNASFWFDGPAKLKKLQDSLAQVNKQFGIARGKPFEKPNGDSIESFYKKVNASDSYDKKLDEKLDTLFDKLANPTVVQKLKPWSVIDEMVKPAMKQLKANLSHYRTKAKNADQVARDLKKSQQRVSDLELKLETLGVNSDIPFIELEKYTATLKAKPLVAVPPLTRPPEARGMELKPAQTLKYK